MTDVDTSLKDIQEILKKFDKTRHYAIKHSLRDNDLSGKGGRGKNSSRGRILEGKNAQEGNQKPWEEVQKKSPEGCVAIALQELINQDKVCLLRGEFSPSCIEIGMLW